jgi:type IV secretory pathway VirB2 component (pilin)
MLSDISSSGSDAVVSATQWIEGAFLGSLATAIAILAVAGIGLLMLTGRVDLRRGAAVVVGCFILFGASTIASALQSLAIGGENLKADYGPPIAVVATRPAITAPPPVPALSDPYAGASVPRNR